MRSPYPHGKPLLRLALLSLAGTISIHLNPARADYQSAVLAKAPVGYWRLNDAVATPPLVLATNLGALGAVGNGTFENDILLGVPGALPAQAATNTGIRSEE